MAQSKASTPTAYLRELEPDRRRVISEVRKMIRAHLPAGYEEAMNWGMICYQVPLSACPDTYNGQPLMYAALAAQKRYCALYLTAVYQHASLEKRLRRAFDKSGLKLDMGKSCVRFRTAGDLPMEQIGRIVAATPMERFIRSCARCRGDRPARRSRPRSVQ
ncbi:MAG: hypothetical protein CMJ18_25165 [Phycisphaeraceae bacterium]|nr:hypothetical protein [Phycisphaeraceae bacterium]